MNKETYEALKRIMVGLKKEIVEREESIISFSDINQVDDWIDEVAKEYIDE